MRAAQPVVYFGRHGRPLVYRHGSDGLIERADGRFARYDGRFATRTAAQQAGATSHVEFCPQLVGICAVAGAAPSLQEWQDAVRKQEVGSRWWCRAGAT